VSVAPVESQYPGRRDRGSDRRDERSRHLRVAPDYELAQFFDFAGDLFCVAGLDGYYKQVNASFERVLGYSREELLSRPFMDFVHPDDVEHATEVLSVLATGEDVIGFESRLICADGSVRRFEWNTRTMPHLGVIYGIARDVTERSALAEAQDALRRVATLVARESSPDLVCSAVVEEVARVVGVDSTAMLRYGDDGTVTPVASRGRRTVPLGARFPLEGDNISSRVFATARPARIDHYAHATGVIGEAFAALGVRSAVGAPIIVEGRLWGAMVAAATEPLPEDTESRMVEFTELVATAIANIDARAELTASRARIVAAADEERRRVARDLHDGAQQRLVHAIITLKLAQQALASGDADAESLVGHALEHMQHATGELRELAHGILPAALTAGGLAAGVDTLVSRTPVPVQVEVCGDRLCPTIEATAYFVIAEALTNVAKHAGAASAAVTVRIEDDTLQIEVRDDGVGGVCPEGSGVQGLADRLAALDGRLRIESPADGGTLVAATIPLAARA
jgi:PAS domain S-box-containing protein